MSLDLSKIFPNLRFVVQDLQHVVEQARSAWQESGGAAVDSERIQFMAHDFFKEQVIKDADVYLLRWVL